MQFGLIVNRCLVNDYDFEEIGMRASGKGTKKG